MQLYLNEEVFSSQSELEYVRDVYLEKECDTYLLCKLLMDNLDKQSKEFKEDQVQRQMQVQ
jgi:hypothetical protein